jgi:hypothetical protein
VAADDKAERIGGIGSGDEAMKEAKDILRTVGIVFLGIVVFVAVAPLALKLVGITLGITFGIIGLLITVAIALIKIAVVLAVGYLILVGIRALLR